MQPEFWHQRWHDQAIGFHEPVPHALLVRHWRALALPAGARVFVPMCGKTLDIDRLLGHGHRVVGSELSPIAAEALFARLGLQPAITSSGSLQCWRAGAMELWVGDHFALAREQLGAVDAVYDRAALIAMPSELRGPYARQMDVLAAGAPQLLITLDYDQSRLKGPPFSVPEEELRSLYPQRSLQRLESAPLEGGLKGQCPASENAWRLGPASRHAS